MVILVEPYKKGEQRCKKKKGGSIVTDASASGVARSLIAALKSRRAKVSATGVDGIMSFSSHGNRKGKEVIL